MIAENTNRVMASPGKIYGAIIGAKRKIGAIGKNGSVTEYGKYDYRKFDDVIDVVAPLMDEFGLLVVSNVISKEERKDGKMHFVTLTMSYRLYTDDGSFIEASQVGEAFDVGDKASIKAQTVALRIFYCTTFNIAYNEMEDPESGQQHVWTDRNKGTLNRLFGSLDSLQDATKLSGMLTSAIKCMNSTQENGDFLTVEDLQKSEEVFTANARRLRFSEKVVEQIKTRIKDAISGKTQTQSAASTVPITVEPVRFRELLLDFGVAQNAEALERCVLTLLQSYKTSTIDRDEISEIVSKYCPENETNGFACFFLGAIHQSSTTQEIAQMSELLHQAMQEKKIGKDVYTALSQYAQHLIDSLGGNHGDA